MTRSQASDIGAFEGAETVAFSVPFSSPFLGFTCATSVITAAGDALAAQELSGWLARMQGEYYSRGKVTLEPLKRIGADREADWQAALAAFHAARR